MASIAAKAPVGAGSSDAGRFLVLDGMRGVAAFAVILDHVSSVTLRAWFPGRYLAVDFFFVLSGFVLAHAYGQKLGQGTLSPLGFMRIRLIRLYPFYLLGLALGLLFPAMALVRGWSDIPWSEVATVAVFGVLFLPAPAFSWTGGHLFPFNGPAWSLFFELIANFIYGFIARYLTWLVLGIGLAVMAALIALAVVRHEDGPGWHWSNFGYGLCRVVYCFFAGVVIYRLREVVRLWAMPAWAAVFALLAIFAVPASDELRPAFDAFAAIVLMPLLVAFVAGSTVGGRAARLCSFLGMLSYGVYALHVPIMTLINYALQVVDVSLPYGFMDVVLVAGVTTIVVAVATQYYDTPFRRLLSGKAKRAPKPVASGEAR